MGPTLRPPMRDEMKRRAGRAAVEQVEDGDVVGLGSGSTAAHAIRALGERVDDGDDLVGVPTSYQSADIARDVGLPVRGLADVTGVDVAIDGADQVADSVLVKGGGGAHAREKVIDAAADTFLVVVDETKLADELHMAIPLEVLPDARPAVSAGVQRLGGDPTVRRNRDRPFVTDNGNHIIDVDFGVITDTGPLADRLASLPGVVEHGLFVDLADAVFVGTADGVTVRDE